MKLYKLLWDTHKWTGIIAGLIFVVIGVTGFLLLVKKEFTWIQPPTARGSEGAVEDFIGMKELFDIVVAHDPDDEFRAHADIDRVDVRPDKRIYKVRANEDYGEIQVDAISGKVLSDDWRPSDLIESIHDGSFFGGWAHDYLMPLVALALLFLVGSGVYLWLSPLLRKRRNRKKAAARRALASD